MRLSFDPKIGEGYAKDKTEEEDDETGDGVIEIHWEGEGFRCFGEPAIIDAGVDYGAGDADAAEQGDRGQRIPAEMSAFVETGEEKTDIAIDDDHIKEAIDCAPGEGLPEAIFRKVGQQVEEENEAPDEDLQLRGGCLAESGAHGTKLLSF